MGAGGSRNLKTLNARLSTGSRQVMNSQSSSPFKEPIPPISTNKIHNTSSSVVAPDDGEDDAKINRLGNSRKTINKLLAFPSEECSHDDENQDNTSSKLISVDTSSLSGAGAEFLVPGEDGKS